MQSVIIAKGYGYVLTSYGNGTSYALCLNGTDRSVFVQGDDATHFREEWEALEVAKPFDHTGELLREMWGRYS